VTQYALRIPIDTHIVLGDQAEVCVQFDQLGFTWINGTEDHFPEVLIPIEHNHTSEYDWHNSSELTALNHFLSLIAATVSQPISIHKWHRYVVFQQDRTWERLPRKQPGFLVPSSKVPIEPASTERSKLALSLYREAVSSSSVFYSFLCYYKVLELGHDQHPRTERAAEIKAYIDTNIHQAINAYPVSIETRHFQSEIPSGETIYRSFRCAIAHASASETRSPDNMADYCTVRLALDYIRALAVFMINSGHFEPGT
jgi:hypothetical protein